MNQSSRNGYGKDKDDTYRQQPQKVKYKRLNVVI